MKKSLIFGTLSLATFFMVKNTQGQGLLDTVAYIPHWGHGNGMTSAVEVTSITPVMGTVKVTFFRSDGTTDGILTDRGVSPVILSLAKFKTERVAVTDAGSNQLVKGWALIESDVRMTAQELFRTEIAGVIQEEIVFSENPKEGISVGVEFDSSSAFGALQKNSGLAVANQGETDLKIFAALKSADATMASGEFILKSKNQVALFVDQLFPAFFAGKTKFSGTVELVPSDAQGRPYVQNLAVVGMAVRFLSRNDGTGWYSFSASPVRRLPYRDPGALIGQPVVAVYFVAKDLVALNHPDADPEYQKHMSMLLDLSQRFFTIEAERAGLDADKFQFLQGNPPEVRLVVGNFDSAFYMDKDLGGRIQIVHEEIKEKIGMRRQYIFSVLPVEVLGDGISGPAVDARRRRVVNPAYIYIPSTYFLKYPVEKIKDWDSPDLNQVGRTAQFLSVAVEAIGRGFALSYSEKLAKSYCGVFSDVMFNGGEVSLDCIAFPVSMVSTIFPDLAVMGTLHKRLFGHLSQFWINKVFSAEDFKGLSNP